MADDSEEKPNAPHHSSTISGIFDTLNKYKRWQKEQREEFLNRQNLESEKLFRLSGESQKKFEQLFDNVSKSPIPEDEPNGTVPEISDISVSLANDLDNYDTLQESSITGHLQRCFNESSQSSVSVSENKVPSIPEKIPVFSEFRNPQFSEKKSDVKEDQLVKNCPANTTVKPKRPFLKKRSGLVRYMPKSSTSGQTIGNKILSKENEPQIKHAQLPQRTLKLKPAIRKPDAPFERGKHIRFDIAEFNENSDIEDLPKTDLQPSSELNRKEGPPCTNEEINFNERNKSSPLSSSSTDHSSFSPQKSKSDISNSGSESLNLSKENKELEEFELLENCVENSSFNSDSSVVQRILQGESAKVPFTSQNYITKLPPGNNMFANDKTPFSKSNTTENIGLSKCLDEVRARKEVLHKVISDINPRIQSLENEISNSKKQVLDDNMSERCSTPVKDLEDENLSNLPECVSDVSPELEISTTLPDSVVDNNSNEAGYMVDYRNFNTDGVLKNLISNQDVSNEEAEQAYDIHDEELEVEQVSVGKSEIREKLLELEKEIETYKQLNARVSSLCKERDAIIKKLQKQQDDFSKYREAEKKKLEAEINEERRQIKREKETFMRCKKFPTKKEREELKMLRQEVEKLQDELKQQKIKYRNDSRRWKNRLEAAENERNSFKLEKIKLEEQCEELLRALKARMNKKPEIRSSEDEEDHASKSVENIPLSKDAETQTEAEEFDFNVFKDSNLITKSNDVNKANLKVHFDLATEYKKNRLDINESINIQEKNSFENNSVPYKESTITEISRPENAEKDTAAVNLSIISVSGEAEFKEIKYDKKVERIYLSGEKEIIFNSGTRKIISTDGKLKFLFYNGDFKEIFPDGREVYRYVCGVTETKFPDGLKVVEHPNGQTEHHYPDGQKEIKFGDGSIHNFYADGSQEVRKANGSVCTLSADGTKTVEFPNGQKEIRTATYKKREFPDGSSKTIYDSGKLETRYSNGRIKIKNKDGKILLDTKYIMKGSAESHRKSDSQ